MMEVECSNSSKTPGALTTAARYILNNALCSLERLLIWGMQMTEKILEKMKKGVYYPGNHLGKKGELSDLVKKGYLQRMDGSFLCGPDSEPNYCLTDKGLSHKGQRSK